jgi:predicted ATP-dependent serine protease
LHCYYHIKERYACKQCNRMQAIQAYGLCPACYQYNRRKNPRKVRRIKILIPAQEAVTAP